MSRKTNHERTLDVARRNGAWAGEHETRPLWGMSKRELVEVALRLGALVAGDGDDADAGLARALEEAEALRDAGII